MFYKFDVQNLSCGKAFAIEIALFSRCILSRSLNIAEERNIWKAGTA